MLLPCPYCDFRLDVSPTDDRSTIVCRGCQSRVDVQRLLRAWRKANTNRSLVHFSIVVLIFGAIWLLITLVRLMTN